MEEESGEAGTHVGKDLRWYKSEKSINGLVALVVKNLPADTGGMRCRFGPWVGKIRWRRAWHPTPGLLPGKSHGQNRLAGYSP